MWAQLQKVRTDPAKQDELLGVLKQLQAIEQEDSGLLRTIAMRSQSDPGDMFVLVMFESEQKAREREQDPRRQDALVGIRATMSGLLDGPPQFFDLDVVYDQ